MTSGLMAVRVRISEATGWNHERATTAWTSGSCSSEPW